jgi:hypothetical protein
VSKREIKSCCGYVLSWLFLKIENSNFIQGRSEERGSEKQDRVNVQILAVCNFNLSLSEATSKWSIHCCFLYFKTSLNE